jgi:hypothetical protein
VIGHPKRDEKLRGESLSMASGIMDVTSRSGMRQGAPACLVMLHLRARYVSKAAILTLPIRFVPVENRSPA